jgi:hypothetical protein
VRNYAFDILDKYPCNYYLFSDNEFVNNVLYKTGLDYSVNPKAMFSEGSALLLKLVFSKSLNTVSIVN